VLTVDMAVSMISASIIMGVDWPLLQDASSAPARNKAINVLRKIFIFHFPLMFDKETLNASRLFQGCSIRSVNDTPLFSLPKSIPRYRHLIRC
jgi:hypothetical protein